MRHPVEDFAEAFGEPNRRVSFFIIFSLLEGLKGRGRACAGDPR